jgi:hypothetical protein
MSWQTVNRDLFTLLTALSSAELAPPPKLMFTTEGRLVLLVSEITQSSPDMLLILYPYRIFRAKGIRTHISDVYPLLNETVGISQTAATSEIHIPVITQDFDGNQVRSLYLLWHRI